MDYDKVKVINIFKGFTPLSYVSHGILADLQVVQEG